MRHFILDNQLFDIRDNQFTADEIAEQGISKVACAPSGALDITEYAEDIKTYSRTHTPSLVDGALTWTERSVVALTEEETLQARKSAYADTLTGSDPLFINYQALVAKGSDNADTAKEEWLSRRDEIKQEYPKNVV